MTVLLVWSGWWQRGPLSWALLSLPLAEALLSLSPLFGPGVLKVRIYPYLVLGMQAFYLGALTVLFSEGLSRCRDGHCSWLVGGCVQVADGAWAQVSGGRI